MHGTVIVALWLITFMPGVILLWVVIARWSIIYVTVYAKRGHSAQNAIVLRSKRNNFVCV